MSLQKFGTSPVEGRGDEKHLAWYLQTNSQTMKQTNEGINTERQETRNIDKNESGLIATCKKI
jgi:hypothetical protein